MVLYVQFLTVNHRTNALLTAVNILSERFPKLIYYFDDKQTLTEGILCYVYLTYFKINLLLWFV